VRYEITGCATNVFTLEQIQSAVRQAGGAKVRSRRAFGWGNQPHVCTFAASNDALARQIASAARRFLPDEPRSLSLIEHAY
jgi:hypothetical protein